MPSRRLGRNAGLAIARETGRARYVIERQERGRSWRVVECRPDGTAVVVEDGLASMPRADTACRRWIVQAEVW